MSRSSAAAICALLCMIQAPSPLGADVKLPGTRGLVQRLLGNGGDSPPAQNSGGSPSPKANDSGTDKSAGSKTRQKITLSPGSGAMRSSSGSGEFSQDQDPGKVAGSSGAEVPLPGNQSGPWQVRVRGSRHYVGSVDMQRFYQFPSHQFDGKHLWLRSPSIILKASVGSSELLLNNVKFILSFPVLGEGDQALFSRLDLSKLIDPVLRPTHITDGSAFDTVVVDAGHGGHDVGARGVYGYEKNYALQLSEALREALQTRGLKVLLSRPGDEFVTLTRRVAIANQTPRCIFISLHFNSGGSSATGIETFALTPQGGAASLERGGGVNWSGLVGNSHDSANIALATAVHAQVVSRFRLVDRGIKRAQWSVLSGCTRPGILFEGGFVTNREDGLRIASPSYQRMIANAIADGIMNYRKALSRAR
jgi:N-acetylmuramoyl-L-alanine amidase